MPFYLILYLVPFFYALAVVRFLLEAFGGRRFPVWLRVTIDLVAVVTLPAFIILDSGSIPIRLFLDPTVARLLIGAAVVAYFLLSYRPGPWSPALEWVLRIVAVLGIVINVVMIHSDFFMAIGSGPIILLFLLALDRAHRQVTGDRDLPLDLESDHHSLDDFRSLAEVKAADPYPYRGALASSLRWSRVVGLLILLTVGAAIYFGLALLG